MNIYIETLGCPKNEADSRVLSGLFLENEHHLTDEPEKADMVIINTCGFILDAAEESIQTLLSYGTQLKKSNPSVKIMALGCLVQRYAQDLIKEMPEVDYWMGLDTLERIVDFIEEFPKGTHIPKTPHPLFLKTPHRFPEDDVSYSYIKIGDGCNRACAFCSIPTFKGEHVSRDPVDIKEEFQKLVKMGKRELIIVDQDITQYQYGETGLAQLIRELSTVEGDYWIRLMYMHPDHISPALFEQLKDIRHLIEYFDIPVQHGSDKVLKNMGRIRTRSELKEQIRSIRAIFPDANLRTTIMLGFEGEGQKEFSELMDFMQEVRFDKVGFFIFSPEEGTPIYKKHFKLEDEQVIQQRLNDITELQKEISAQKNEQLLNRRMKLIVDSYEGDIMVCRSYKDAPEIDSEIFVRLIEGDSRPRPSVGNFIDAIITDYDDYDLEAEWI
ncbi:MAG TPA: 30S ribosomal protein S12 methylthiotransferase RimO [Thermotogota bacterium]|nr:30S ribosomal protein S12 methylthiotransferase RimO [Thermotogota bacterium]HRW33895.1 30S ribosomal protein S12 methylthiotransferase RimO [Thermotogota bacterium]